MKTATAAKPKAAVINKTFLSAKLEFDAAHKNTGETVCPVPYDGKSGKKTFGQE
jgi:hypothetical protein